LFSGVSKTGSFCHSVQGRIHRGPENKCAPQVIHRELRIIRRISREHPQDRAQDSAIEGWLPLSLGATMNTLSSKLTTFAAALAMNALVLGALGYLFALQSHPNMSAIAFAKAVVAHQWLFSV
jgi:hypothetical protein